MFLIKELLTNTLYATKPYKQKHESFYELTYIEVNRFTSSNITKQQTAVDHAKDERDADVEICKIK